MKTFGRAGWLGQETGQSKAVYRPAEGAGFHVAGAFGWAVNEATYRPTGCLLTDQVSCRCLASF